MSEEKREFDPNNFCIQMESSDDIDRIQRALHAIRPDDYKYPEVELSNEPYWGVLEGELFQSALEWVDPMPLGALMVHIISHKLQQIMLKAGSKVKVEVHKWNPMPGDIVNATMTGTVFRKAIFMYRDELNGKTKYYCVPLASIEPTELDTGQKIIKLTAYSRIEPVTE